MFFFPNFIYLNQKLPKTAGACIVGFAQSWSERLRRNQEKSILEFGLSKNTSRVSSTNENSYLYRVKNLLYSKMFFFPKFCLS